MFRLKYRGYDVAVAEGEFAIGRGVDCQLCLSDPIVSRRHAVIHALRDLVVIEDCGSRNGVIVNGERVAGRRTLADGDTVVIGGQEMTFHVDPTPAGARPGPGRGPASGPARAAAIAGQPPAAKTMAHSVMDGDDPLLSFEQLYELALSALEAGRAREAERVLERPLAEVLSRCRCGLEVAPALCEAATAGAARLAEATRNGYWVDYVFDLSSIRGAPLGSAVCERLTRAAASVMTVDETTVRMYVEARRRAAQADASGRDECARLDQLADKLGVRC